MVEFNEQQAVFIKELVEEELTKLKFRRSRSISVRGFDEIHKERIEFLRDVLDGINKQIRKDRRYHMFKNMIKNNCMVSGSNSISMSDGKVTINGEELPKDSNLAIIDGFLYVDGKKYNRKNFKDNQVINLTIVGDVNNVDCDGHVEIIGNVNGDINCEGDVTIKGDHNGRSIDCGGSVKIIK